MMNNMYVILLFLVTSSVLSVSSNNDDEIFMVLDDPTSMHPAGTGMSKAEPVEIGKLRLEDGKVFTLARKSAPSKRCVPAGQPCGLLNWCCGDLWCVAGWPIYGIC
ncbi:hypothetical protein Tco_0829096, partial [Tanacetum coccineum]